MAEDRGKELVAQVKRIVHEGNVRRIMIKNDQGRTLLQIPVTVGVVAVLAAPIVTALGAIAGLTQNWKIEVERADDPAAEPVEVVPAEAERV
ncbi:DUF4342 domain-containing protein [Actinokineospora enzanensis]|uniref:DUF4342 domain-containing protein n=1 Tax=Actinokineospora enzanensis TaxID=155975 RepID=UPI000372D672|nr:DUF4342 domain-containing protein [Actinokineospora enzanensis]